MRRASIVCTLTCFVVGGAAACGGADLVTPSPEGPDASIDAGSSKHHDASTDASGGEEDDDGDDDASSPTDSGASRDATAPADAGPDGGPEAGPDASPDGGLPLPAGQCTSSFGHGLTNGYGRLDGVLQAYVKPTATTCPDHNSTHLVLQIALSGALYEIDVNVKSDDGTEVFTTAIDAPLVGGAFSPGWHTGVSLDYASDLDVHSSAGFTAYAETDLVNLLAAQLTNGTPIIIYGEGFVTGAHDIHRLDGGDDGAIVIDPTGSPHWLLFHFDEQTF